MKVSLAQPDWICNSCGVKYGAYFQGGNYPELNTSSDVLYKGTCEVCGNTDLLDKAENFGNLIESWLDEEFVEQEKPPEKSTAWQTHLRKHEEVAEDLKELNKVNEQAKAGKLERLNNVLFDVMCEFLLDLNGHCLTPNDIFNSIVGVIDKELKEAEIVYERLRELRNLFN